MGIYLIVVFEPGKASFYPEYIPDSFKPEQKAFSNFDYYTKRAKELGIHYTDLDQYFLRLKSRASYPLFPKYGTHWSVYGMSFAADSLVKLIEATLHENLGGMFIGPPEISRKPRDTDYDVGKTMNLLFPLPGYDLAYPSFTFREDSLKVRPMVLTVADSYYWNIFNTGLPKHLFANEAFWYFNAKVYPDTYYTPKSVDDLDIRKEIEKQQVIFLMVTERFLYKFDWGFIDRVYELYTPSWLRDPVYDNVNKIVRYSPWFDDVITKAKKNGINLEKQLYADAEYVLETDNKTEYLVWKGPEYYEHKIRSDSAWLANVSRKASEKGISMEEMLAIDDDFLFKTEEPGLYDIYYGIRATEEKIRSNGELMESTTKEAEKYRSDPVLMIRLRAEQLYEEGQVMQTERAIRSDPKWLQDVAAKAVQNKITLDEMVRMDARYVYDQKRKGAK